MGGVIGGPYNLTEGASGTTGTLVLGASNTYLGTTTISDGELSISADNNLGPAPSVATPGSVIINGGTLAATSTFTLNANRGITLGGSGGSIDVAGSATFTYDGIVAGSGDLTVTDDGVLALGGANTYTGTTTLSGGELSISADDNLGTAPGAATPSSLILDDGMLATTDTFTLDANREIRLVGGYSIIDVASSTTLTYNGIVAGLSDLTINTSGAGELVLGGDNTYVLGTEIIGGTLQVGAPNAIPSTSDVQVGASATLDLDGQSVTTGALNGSGTVTSSDAGSATLTEGANNNSGTFSGVIQNGSGTVALTKIGSGTETLSGADTYSGPTTVSAGTLQVGASNAIPSTSDVTDNATLDLHGKSITIGVLTGSGTVTTSLAGSVTLTVGATNDSGTFSGVIHDGSGTIALAVNGTGTETLSGANTYSGPTTVSAGTLDVDGSLSSSSVTVNSGGTLGGTGTVGAITDNSGGTVEPGVTGATGILNTGTATLNSGSKFAAVLNGTTAGTGYDQLNITGTANLGNSTFELVLGSNFTASASIGASYAIVSTTQGVSGTFSGLASGATINASGNRFTISYTGGHNNDDVVLTFEGSSTTTTVALTTGTNPAVYGTALTFTATVTSTSLPTGTVEFYDGATPLGPGSALAGTGLSAISTFTISTLSAGTHAMNAVYTATGSNAGNPSGNLSQTVHPLALDLTGSRVYDGTATAGSAILSVSNAINGDLVDVASGSATLAGANVGAEAITNFAGLTLGGSSAANYTLTGATGLVTITPATATIIVTPYTVAYDGTAHAATGTATGAGGANLSSDLDLSGTTHTSVGTYNGDVWTFTDPTGNYRSASGTVNDVVTQPTPTPTPTPPPVIIGEQALIARKTNKKGKPVGKPVLTGYEFEFSRPLDPASAATSANYQVDNVTTKRIKKKVVRILKPITTFHVSYSNDAVTIAFAAQEAFKTGGQITVLDTVTGASAPRWQEPRCSRSPRAGRASRHRDRACRVRLAEVSHRRLELGDATWSELDALAERGLASECGRQRGHRPRSRDEGRRAS